MKIIKFLHRYLSSYFAEFLSKEYLEPSRTSTMEFFLQKIVTLIVFVKKLPYRCLTGTHPSIHYVVPKCFESAVSNLQCSPRL